MQEAWHIPLRAEAAAAAAAERLADLTWSAPNVTLVDGRGVRFTPWSTDPAELADHTIREQPVTTYDFARSLRVALREYAPDVILLPGPGASLGEVLRPAHRGRGLPRDPNPRRARGGPGRPDADPALDAPMIERSVALRGPLDLGRTLGAAASRARRPHDAAARATRPGWRRARRTAPRRGPGAPTRHERRALRPGATARARLLERVPA